MFKKTLLFASALMLVMAAGAMACGDDASTTNAQKASIMTSDTPQELTMKGQLVCMGCTLKADGAQSACSEFGCSHALKLEDGHIVSLLQNKFSRSLIAGEKMHDKNVEITGTFFANANVLDVKSYALEGDKAQSWCAGHELMDACMASH